MVHKTVNINDIFLSQRKIRIYNILQTIYNNDKKSVYKLNFVNLKDKKNILYFNMYIRSTDMYMFILFSIMYYILLLSSGSDFNEKMLCRCPNGHMFVCSTVAQLLDRFMECQLIRRNSPVERD